MNKKTFGIRSALSYGWKTVKSRPVFFILLPLIPLLAQSLCTLLGNMILGGLNQLAVHSPGNTFIPNISAVVAFVIQIGSWLLSGFLGLGVNGVYRATVEGKVSSFKQVVSYKSAFISYILAGFVVGVVSMVGFLLFIIPGIIWVLATQLYVFSVFTPGNGPIAAIKESIALTKGVRIKLLLFGIVSGLLNLGGIFCLFVGVFVTIPITGLAMAYIYQSLKGHKPPEAVLEAAVASS